MLTIEQKIKFISSVFGTGKISSTRKQFDIWCPFCAPTDKSKRKLSIRLLDDFWHCWTCDHKGRSLVTLIKRFGTRDQLIEYRDKFIPEHAKLTIQIDEEEKKVVALPKDFKLLMLANSIDPDVKACIKYCHSRGISERDMWYYKLGVSDDPRWHRRVIVPSFDAYGTLNYFVARAIDKQRKPKYDNPDFDKLPIVFNEINIDWTQPVVLCEGVFDCIKCGENAIPLLGSSLHEKSAIFNAITLHGTPTIIALDADMANKRVPVIARNLAEYDIDVSTINTFPFKDPGEMTKEQFLALLKEAKPFSWNDIFSSKLARAASVSLSMHSYKGYGTRKFN